MNPVIIECAINGVTSKSTNIHVPVEPPEIVADALGCIEAGAAIIHNHIDRYGLSVEQAVERYLEAWRPVLAARPDALLYPTVHFERGIVNFLRTSDPTRRGRYARWAYRPRVGEPRRQRR
jgi:uncharacterized protein (DUF849 family)